MTDKESKLKKINTFGKKLEMAYGSPFQDLKERIFCDGDLNEKEFNAAFVKFIDLTYQEKKHTESEIIAHKPLEEFEVYLQKQIIGKKLNSLKSEHGQQFKNLIHAHLNLQEPQVLSGEKSYKDSVFFNLSFSDQVSQLIPYIAQKTGMDEEVLHHHLLDSSLSKENFDDRLDAINNMSKWSSLLGKSELARQFVLQLGDPFLNKPIKEKDYKHDFLKIFDDACLINKSAIYSPNIIAKSYRTLLEELSNQYNKDILQAVKHAGNMRKIKKKILRYLFETWALQEAIQDCKLQGQAFTDVDQAFLSSMLACYETGNHLPKTTSIDYLKETIKLAIEIFVNNDISPVSATKVMQGEGKNKTLFKLNQIDKSSPKFTEEKKTQSCLELRKRGKENVE